MNEQHLVLTFVRENSMKIVIPVSLVHLIKDQSIILFKYKL